MLQKMRHLRLDADHVLQFERYLSFRVNHVLPVVEQLQLNLVELLLERLAALAVLDVLHETREAKKKKNPKWKKQIVVRETHTKNDNRVARGALTFNKHNKHWRYTSKTTRELQERHWRSTSASETGDTHQERQQDNKTWSLRTHTPLKSTLLFLHHFRVLSVHATS